MFERVDGLLGFHLSHNGVCVTKLHPHPKGDFWKNSTKPLVTLNMATCFVLSANLNGHSLVFLPHKTCAIQCTIIPQSLHISIFSEVRSTNTVVSKMCQGEPHAIPFQLTSGVNYSISH